MERSVIRNNTGYQAIIIFGKIGGRIYIGYTGVIVVDPLNSTINKFP
jgi:hypothetical protein